MTPESLGRAAALYLGFVAALFVLRKILPGPTQQGQQLRDGSRKTYKLNGFYMLLVLAAAIVVGQVRLSIRRSVVGADRAASHSSCDRRR